MYERHPTHDTELKHTILSGEDCKAHFRWLLAPGMRDMDIEDYIYDTMGNKLPPEVNMMAKFIRTFGE